MSDILSGQTDHSTYAPLTQAQTIAICQHLQQEIRSVEATMSELQRDLMHTNEYVTTLKTRSADSNEEVHSMKVAMCMQNAALDKLTNEHARTAVSVSEVQETNLSLKTKIVALDEANRLADTTQDMLVREFKAQKESIASLSAAMEQLGTSEFKKLTKELATTKLFLDQVASEQSVIEEQGQQNRTLVRECKAEVENIINEVKRSNTVTSILESRLQTTTQGVQTNLGRFVEVERTLLKVTECYEQTKARVADVEIKFKEVNDAAKITQHDLEDRTRDLEALSDKVKANAGTIESQSGSTEEIRHQVNGVRGECQQLSRKVQSIAAELKEVGDVTRQVRSGLKEQSSMLLPNINMDSPGGGGMAQMDFGSPGSRAGTASSTKRPAGAGAW